MPDFDDSTLWPVSAFERERARTATQGGPTLVSSTLQAELHLLHRQGLEGDLLQVAAACVRLRQPALLFIDCEGLVWPVTLFPADMRYHARRSLAEFARDSLARLRLIEVAPPSVRAPGPWMHVPEARAEAYHPLAPALWALALHGPSASVLGEIGGTAAYRALHRPADEGLPTPGALGAAVERLRQETMSLARLASLPGMSTERAQRLLNALYLSANLMVSRAHPAARGTGARPR